MSLSRKPIALLFCFLSVPACKVRKNNEAQLQSDDTQSAILLKQIAEARQSLERVSVRGEIFVEGVSEITAIPMPIHESSSVTTALSLNGDASYAKVQSQINTLRKALVTMTDELKEASAEEKVVLQVRIDGFTSAIATLEADLKNVNDAQKKDRNAINSLAQRADALEAEINRLNNETSNKIADLQRQIDELKKQKQPSPATQPNRTPQTSKSLTQLFREAKAHNDVCIRK